jgi:putative transposase
LNTDKENDGKEYASDLDNKEWELVKHFFETTGKRGRPPRICRRLILNAIFYQLRTSCQWHMLPNDLPHHKNVHRLFKDWTDNGLIQKIQETLADELRAQALPDQPRETANLDSQSTKSNGAHEKVGFDGGKRVNGRKRHILVDSLGLILAVLVTAANVPEGRAGIQLLEQLRAERVPQLKTIYGDSAYQKCGFPAAAEQKSYVFVRPTKPIAEQKCSKCTITVQRGLVEQTFGWLAKYRRLNRCYEHQVSSEESMIRLASIRHLLQRLTSANKLKLDA